MPSKFPFPDAAPPDPELARQLDRILNHPLFKASYRLSRFLRFVVNEHRSGRPDQLKEYTIGVEVFERETSYNPQEDPIVRTMAGRLRGKLAEYYQGDGKEDPVLIEIPRGGYVPRLTWRRLSYAPASELAPIPAAPRRRNLVGREAESERLMQAFASVDAGAGVALMVSGEAGVGKTSLVEDFLSAVEAKQQVVVGRGRCSERLAQTDALAPIWECLDQVVKRDRDGHVPNAMRNLAPSWYLGVVPAPNATPAGPPATASHEQMRRELVAFLDHLAQARPVVLFLDDLHWADASTCDLLAYLGARIQRARVLVLLTYRAAAISAKGHPFLPVKIEMERRGAIDLPLPSLALNDIRRYIAQEFPANDFPPDLAIAVHDRTDGNPLFMTEMLRFLCGRGMLADRGERWSLELPVSEVRKLIPLGVRSMIELQIGQLAERDRSLLLCAAVQGIEFDSAPLATVLALEPVDVEERLQALERGHNFVQKLGEREFRGGVVSVRYRFAHVFHQNALYESLAPSRRAAYSLEFARRLTELLGEESRTAAADLAVLFETGKDYANACRHFLQAALNAARVSAYPEAALLCRHGLDRLASLDQTGETDSLELKFSMTLGMSLMATLGYAAAEVEPIYQRSRALCIQLHQPRRLLSVLWALHTCQTNRGDLMPALAVANEMRQVAESLNDQFAMTEALFAGGSTLGFLGRWADAKRTLERVFEAYPLSEHSLRASLYVLDPCVGSLSMLARVLAFAGDMDQAITRAAEAVDLANRLSHAPTLAYATFWIAFVHHVRQEDAAAIPLLESSMTLSREHGLPLFVEWGRMLLGSALTRTGKVAEGIATIRKSIDRQTAMGSWLERSYCLTLLAQALKGEGRQEADEALRLCDEAIEFARRTGGRCYEPEIHRVRGDILLSLGHDSRLAEARGELERALQLAREAGCRLLELRAALSYFHLQRRAGDRDPGREVLAAVLGDLTEGTATPLVQEAVNALQRQPGDTKPAPGG